MLSDLSWKRCVALTPVLLLATAGVALVLASLAKLGDVPDEHPAWVPAIVGFQVALPMLIIGSRALVSVWLDSRLAFHVVFPHCLSGILVAAAGLAGWSIAQDLFANGVYDGSAVFRLDPDNPVWHIVAGCLITALFLTAALTLISYAYVRSVESRAPSKWDKQAGEPDAIGSILRESQT